MAVLKRGKRAETENGGSFYFRSLVDCTKRYSGCPREEDGRALGEYLEHCRTYTSSISRATAVSGF